MHHQPQTYFQKRIALLQRLSQADEDAKALMKHTINSLSFILTEIQPGYAYNESYLNEFSNRFFGLLEKVHFKQELTCKLAAKIRKCYPQLTVTVDEIWHISTKHESITIKKTGSLEHLNKNTILLRITDDQAESIKSFERDGDLEKNICDELKNWREGGVCHRCKTRHCISG